jgi:Zn-dependent metalloprotease
MQRQETFFKKFRRCLPNKGLPDDRKNYWERVRSRVLLMRNCSLHGGMTVQKWIFCAVIILCAIGHSPLKAQDSTPLLLQKIQQNSFSMGPSTTVSLNDAVQASDSRGAEIAKRLKDRIEQLKARKTRPSGTSQKLRSARGQSSPPQGQVRQVLADVPQVRMNRKTGTPRQIKGKRLQRALQEMTDSKERAEQTGRQFLRNFKDTLRIKDPNKDLQLYRTQKDDLDRTHLRYAQRHQGLRVWPPELIVHLDPEGDVDLMTGSTVPMPRKLTLTPFVKAQEAQKTAQEAIPNGKRGKVSKPDLIIYAPNNRTPRLAWKMTVNVSLVSQWTVIVDAVNGAKLETITQVMDANVSGSGVDLFGTTRSLNVWQEGGTFFMVDTSKSMFDPSSNPPDPTTTRGGIIIQDAQNQPPTSDPTSLPLPDLFDVTSSKATSGWLPDAVSAAFGLSETYDYYLSRHNRNSLDGQGGAISAVVRYGQNAENAFYLQDNQIMFFGDARPYAGALDVVGHELTHGVTDTTANLVYKNQSGALNEAFSDIFGEMVEARTKGMPDWLKGGPDLGITIQDYMNPNAVPCTRSSPCPAKMSQYIFTTQDHGGVHSNSSIINHAFYLLAEGLSGAIGLIDAEKIFYRTLTTKLVAGSEFIDARLGAITSAEELFGVNSNQVQRTREAFDAVEIVEAPPTPEPPPFPEVSGPDATIFGFFDNQLGAFFLGRREVALGDPLQGSFLSNFPIDPFVRPSVTGDGTRALFINPINDLCFIRTDGALLESCLGFPGTFFSAAMSPDGNRFAMVLLDQFGVPENTISLIDLVADTEKIFPLKAPLLDGGTIEVLLADALDFSADGNTIFYDAFNQIQFQNGSEIGLWSIYSIDLATDLVTAVVPPTPGFDIANPSVSQTSDQFLTFEGVNAITGDVEIVLYDLFNGTLGSVPPIVSAGFRVLPGYTGDDTALVFSAPDATPTGLSLFRLSLNGDRITPSGPPSLWLPDGRTGVIYRRGTFSGGESFTLNVTKSGAGGGLVTSVPSGIVCGTGCQSSFPADTTVVLTALPETGSTFSGWSGGGCSGTGTCTVVLTSNVTVTGTFAVAAPNNTAPTVSAESDQTITFPTFAFLDGSVTDDGLPSGTVTTTWSKVSGSGTVTFGNANAVDTTATFSQADTYTLRLTAHDGLLQASADVVITVNVATPGEPTLYDLNGDRKADIVWRNTSDGAVGGWLMSGLTRGPTGIPGGLPANWIMTGIGDLNGDERADLVWRDTATGDVAAWLMDGLNTPTKGVYAGRPTAAWVIKGVGDLNGDGKADLVWRNTVGGPVAGWLMDGLNAPSKGVIPGAPTAAWVIKGVGDLNGDGKADLVWRNTTDGSVAAWLMDGLNPPTKGLIPGTPSAAWVIAGIVDLNNDDKADLVWRNMSTGDVAGWLMDGFNPPTKGVIKASVPLAWVIENVADLDGDDKADLVWRNTNDGSVAGWLMNGLSPLTKDLITGSVPVAWEIQR